MFDLTMSYHYWVLGGLVLIALELFVPTFVTIWFGFSALIVGVLLSVNPDLSITCQISAWLVFAALWLALWFLVISPCRKNHSKETVTKAMQSASGVVIHKSSIKGYRGCLRLYSPILGEEEWPFVSDTDVELGGTVTVIEAIDKKTLKVQPLNQPGQ